METQVLTDPALMLVLNPLAAGGFHSQNGRQIELAAEKVEDASRHVGIVIEKSLFLNPWLERLAMRELITEMADSLGSLSEIAPDAH